MFIKILFRGAQPFSILLSGVQFFLLYHWRWYYVILDNLSSCFMIHMLSGMRYLNPSFSSLELSWYRFHLKPSIGDVAIVVLINDASFLGYIISKLHLITARLHLVFSTSLSFRYPFYYRSSSAMMVHQGFNSFSKCSSRFFSKELKYSSFCYLECNSFFCIIGGGIKSFLII